MRTLFDPPSSHKPTPPAAPATPTIRPDGQRACAVCGAPAPFGANARLLGVAVAPVGEVRRSISEQEIVPMVASVRISSTCTRGARPSGR
jgi:hypothetical protein